MPPLKTSFCGCCPIRTGVVTIGVLSMVAGLAGAIYFSAMAAQLLNIYYSIDGVREGTAYWRLRSDWRFGEYYYSTKRWHHGIVGVIAAMAFLHVISLATSAVLLFGLRKAKPMLMTPWLITEALKVLISLPLGIAMVLMASSWARQMAEFIVAMTYGWIDLYQVSLTEDFIRTQFTALGVCLVIMVFIVCYFLLVVASYWKQMKVQTDLNGNTRPA